MISELLTAFFYSVLSISVLLCYRAGKILNLSFASFLTLGAYLSTFNALLSLPTGALAGYFLHLATRKLNVANSTMFSLGFAIAIEEMLRIFFKTQYLLIPMQRVVVLEESILEEHLLSGIISITFLAAFFTFFFSQRSAVLRIVEEDYEISEIYGVRTERIRAIVLTVTSSIVCLLGSFQHSGIVYPTIGWHFLIFAVIVATIANLTSKPYPACILFASVVSWLTRVF